MPIALAGSPPVPQLAVIPDPSVGHRQLGRVARRSSPDELTRESEFDDDRGKDDRLDAVKINHSMLTRRIDELYTDAQVCAQVAGLAYVSDNEPGIVRQRRKRGWSVRDAATGRSPIVRSRRGFSPWLSHPRAGMCRSAPTRTGISWPSEWTRRGQPIRSSSSSRGEIRVASKSWLTDLSRYG
jgi:hypothetical protein